LFTPRPENVAEKSHRQRLMLAIEEQAAVGRILAL